MLSHSHSHWSDFAVCTVYAAIASLFVDPMLGLHDM